MVDSSDTPAASWRPDDFDLEDARLLNHSAEDIALRGLRITRSRHSGDSLHGPPSPPPPGPKPGPWERWPRLTRVFTFLASPRNPLPFSVRPIFPAIQRQPAALVGVVLPSSVRRTVAKILLFSAWLAVFTFLVVLRARPLHDGSSGAAVARLACSDSLWPAGDACGLDGIRCAPFANVSVAFACPAHCSASMVLEPRPVGPVEVLYKPLVVGSGVYRADSFVCAAALHAGVISNERGGCGRLTRVGHHETFEASIGKHDIESIAFDSYFPFSFAVNHDSSIECDGPTDLDKLAFLSTVLFTALVCVFATSPAFTFFSVFFAAFSCVAFVSDPPPATYMSAEVLPDRLSAFAGNILPAAFCAVILYLTCIRRVLDDLAAPAEKTVLWLGGLWFGALSNRTFEWLPIQRLTAHDLEQQPGAKAALAGILAFLIVAVAGQVYCFWREGRLLRYLALYLGILFSLGSIGVLAAPGNSLRLHHYVIALILLPGTSVQTRPSLIYQGLLIGLLINGVARWGFAPLLETPAALRGNGLFGSPIPDIPVPLISLDDTVANINFSFPRPPDRLLQSSPVDGISAVVNDVERHRGFFGQEEGGNGGSIPFVWTKQAEQGRNEYLRFAYVRGGHALDYSRPYTWFSNGTFA